MDTAIKDKALAIMRLARTRAEATDWLRVTLGLYYLAGLMKEESIDLERHLTWDDGRATRPLPPIKFVRLSHVEGAIALGPMHASLSAEPLPPTFRYHVMRLDR